MTLEAMDDNVIAKLLVPEGSEVQVGTPIMVLIEDGVDFQAFADFVAPAAAAASVQAAAPAKAAPLPAPVPTPTPAPAAAKALATPAPAPAQAQAQAPAQAAGASPDSGNAAAYTASVRTMHGNAPGPLHGKLAADQHAYIARFGGGLHRPLALPDKTK